MSLSPWTLDRADSRELTALLERLEPQQRIAFVNWCCQQVTGPVQGVKVTSHTGTAREAFLDLQYLSAVFGLDLDMAARQLVRLVRSNN